MNYDVVLHLDSNDPAKMRLVLRNAANYLNALPGEDFQLHIVANGGGAVLFTDDHEVFSQGRSRASEGKGRAFSRFAPMPWPNTASTRRARLARM